MFAAAAFVLTACAPKPQEVAEKIANHEELSQKDYTVMLESARQMINQMSDSLDKYQKDKQALAAALFAMSSDKQNEFLFAQEFLNLDPETLDEENRRLYDGLKKESSVLTERLQELMGAPSSIRTAPP